MGKQSKVFNDVFIIPLGIFFLMWKRFGWEKSIGMVKSLASAFGLVGDKAKKAGAEMEAADGKTATKGGLLSRIKSRFGGSSQPGGGMGIGGSTGEGVPGTKTDPIVTTTIDPKYAGMGEEAEGYEAEEEGGAAAGGSSVVKRVREATGEKTLGSDAEDAAGSGGILAKLKSLLPGAGGAAGDAEGAAAGAEGGGLLAGIGSLGSISAVAAPVAAVVAAILGLAKATGTLGKLKNEVVKPFAAAWQEAGGLIENAIGGKGGADNLFGTLKTDAVDALGTIEKFIKSPGFKSGFKEFEDVLGGIAQFIGVTLVADVRDGITIITGIIKTFKDTVSSIADIFTGVFKVIKGIVTGNKADIEQGFKDIGKGILDGLKVFVVDIPSMLLNLFKDMVKQVEGYLGINSPSTLFETIGKNIVAGLKSALEEIPKLGLTLGEDLAKEMVKGVKNLAGDVAGAIKGAASGAAHTAGSVGGFLYSHTLGHLLGSSGMSMPGFAGGGKVPGREFGLQDRMTLVDPEGRPRAKMAGDENIYTRHQRPYVDAGLRMIGFNGSEDLWNRVKTPHSYSGGGSLLSAAGRIANFAGGGTLGPASDRTISATLSKSATSGVDTKVSALDNQYTNQDNIYELYNPNGLSVKQLGVLMGIREQQWDLLYGEWLKLPSMLKTLQSTAYGASRGPNGNRTGGLRTTVNDLTQDINVLDNLVTLIGGDSKPGSAPSPEALLKLHNITNTMSPKSIATYQADNNKIKAENAQRATKNSAAQSKYANQSSTYTGDLSSQVDTAINNIPGSPSNGTMNDIYAQNALQMAQYTDQLMKAHTTTLSLTKQINNLLERKQTARGSSARDISKQLVALRSQRVNANDTAIKITSDLGDLHTANQNIGVEYQDQAYFARFAAAAAKTGLTGKTTQLELVLRQLRTELAKEKALEEKAVSAIDTIKGKINGSGGDDSIVDDLSNYGYDMMELNQQGAKVPGKYVSEIDKVFKALGIKLPADWQSAAATAQATQGQQSLQAFQSSLSSVFGSYGNNFVGAGKNPYGGVAGQYAGNANYGAAGGASMHEMGGTLAGNSTPYGGTSSGGGTEINITQHFGGPPPDAHTYSAGLSHELTSMM